jgi:hypothetical protein
MGHLTKIFKYSGVVLLLAVIVVVAMITINLGKVGGSGKSKVVVRTPTIVPTNKVPEATPTIIVNFVGQPCCSIRDCNPYCKDDSCLIYTCHNSGLCKQGGHGDCMLI